MSTAYSLTDLHILIVDDEASNLKLLDRMLRGQGYHHLTLAGDPRQVMDLYRAEHPDLILLDVNMPYLDGYQVMQQLQELNDPLLPPIIILTAQSSKDYLLRSLALGARDFVSKPFDVSELIMRVRNLLEARLAHRLLLDQKNMLEEMVRSRTEELHHTRLEIVQRLGKAAEYRDEETGNHILRMSHTSALLARALGWSAADCDLILNASPMHDIGKIGIPDAILRKPGKLDADEWETMKTHAEIGARLLEGDDSSIMQMARDIAWCHHEKWDGSGYPRGLAGAAIPMAARIAALADVFDALTSERPYKHAWTVEEAMVWIREGSGRHFDPQLVGLLERSLAEILQIRERFSEP